MRTYDKPPQQATARAIHPQQQPNTLTPESEVTIIFRGGPPVVDMFNSRDYVIPPKPAEVNLDDWRKTFHAAEHFTIPFGIAQHLQTRAIVPGTRNRDDYRKAASQIGILNVDKPEICLPFTPEQLERFGGTFQEGIDREGDVVEFKSVREIAQRRMATTGVNLDREVADAAAAPHEPAAEGGEGVAAAQAAEAQAEAQGRKVSGTKPGRVVFGDDPSKQRR